MASADYAYISMFTSQALSYIITEGPNKAKEFAAQELPMALISHPQMLACYHFGDAETDFCDGDDCWTCPTQL